jgi:hypothetical protein
MDILGCVWIAQISFGPLGKLIRVRSLFRYPHSYPYLSDISMQESAFNVQRYLFYLSTEISLMLSIYILSYSRYPILSKLIHKDL